MTTQAIRNPKTDHLLTAENAALILIDFQPGLVDGTNSIRREALVNNVVALAKTAKLFEMPVILSTIAVEAGYQEPTIPELIEVLPNVTPIDRTAVNAWEQPEFRAAVEALGRRKLIIAGLWTEVCLVFPALDLLKEGYEVYAVSDASGGTSVDAHQRAMERVIQAGAVPVNLGGRHGRAWPALQGRLHRQLCRNHVRASVQQRLETRNDNIGLASMGFSRR